jgi:broad specificity phosphatase PhoE
MEGRGPVKVYLARHGQTAWNRRDVVCGRTDIPLT